MAKTTKSTYKPAKINNYKPVVRMTEGGNVSELDYSERRAYIEERYAPFITDAQMIFSIWNSGLEYDLKGDWKEVKKEILDHYESLSDYTEKTLPEETIYEIKDWSLVRKDIDPETDEVIDEVELEELSADNTYNFSYRGLIDLNWRVYHDVDYDRYFYVIMPHLGGDIRGNYGDAFILEGNDKDELFYRFYEGFISGGASIYLKFADGSEVAFDSEQDSDVFYFRLSEAFEPTGMAEKFVADFEKFDTWYGDEFLEETIDVYFARKGQAPKMMAGGGSLNDETPKAYIQILGDNNEGKWIDLTDYSDGQDVIDNIYDWMNELNQEDGGNREEYEVLDYEGFGRDLYDEYMGANEFDEIIEAYDKFSELDFPSDVVAEYKDNMSSGDRTLLDVLEEMENNHFGIFENYNDFGYQMVEEKVFSPSINNVFITETDKRILAGEEADSVVQDMNFEQMLNIATDVKDEYDDEISELEDKISELDGEIEDLISLQGDAVDDEDEYERISEEIEEKELERDDLQSQLDDIDSRYEDKARNEAQEVLYDEIHDRLENDLEGWLEEYGYDTNNLEDVSFLSIDYEEIGEEASDNFLVIEYDGQMYFFNNYAKGGRLVAKKRKPQYKYYIVESSTKKLVSGYESKEQATEQRKLLVKEYPSMRFEIFTLANLEKKTDLDVYAKKDYVELSTLDKIKKVSVDAYRYGEEKVGQANAFLKKHDVKGRIKRGARTIWDKTKQGGNWLKRQWQEADFGDGKGKAKFFADGGEADNKIISVYYVEEDNRGEKMKLLSQSIFSEDKLREKLKEAKEKTFDYLDKGLYLTRYEVYIHPKNVRKPYLDKFKVSFDNYSEGSQVRTKPRQFKEVEVYGIKNENGWLLGFKGSSAELQFSPHTMPITFTSNEMAQEFIDRNSVKNPFIKKGVVVKLKDKIIKIFNDGGESKTIDFASVDGLVSEEELRDLSFNIKVKTLPNKDGVLLHELVTIEDYDALGEEKVKLQPFHLIYGSDSLAIFNAFGVDEVAGLKRADAEAKINELKAQGKTEKDGAFIAGLCNFVGDNVFMFFNVERLSFEGFANRVLPHEALHLARYLITLYKNEWVRNNLTTPNWWEDKRAVFVDMNDDNEEFFAETLERTTAIAMDGWFKVTGSRCFADGGSIQYVPVQQMPQKSINSPLRNMNVNTDSPFVKGNPQVLGMLKDGGVTEEIVNIDNRIYNLKELVTKINEEDKPEMLQTIKSLEEEKANLLKKGNNKEEIKERKSFFSFFKEGGETQYDVYDNKRMLENQAQEVHHHSEELNNQITATKQVPAWVIAKMERATTDLSDITHYLDGENKMADGGSLDGDRHDVVPYGDKFVIVKVYQREGSYSSKSGVIIRDFNGNPMKFNDIKSAQQFIDNMDIKYPYGVPKANAGMLLLASQLMQQKQPQQPQVVYYVPQPQAQVEQTNSDIIQNVPQASEGGDIDDSFINDFCITNLIELANAIQQLKYFVTDRFKTTDKEYGIYKGRLILVFKEEMSVSVVEAINKFIEEAEDCHHIFEQAVNVSGSKPNSLDINLLTDKFSDKEFGKGGKVYKYAPKKINLEKTKKITTNLGDYILGLITDEFVYFVNEEESDENAQTIMYNKKGELVSDNYFATSDLFDKLLSNSEFEYIHPNMKAYKDEQEKEEQEIDSFKVFNYTDNIYATDEVFNSKSDANKFIDEFRKRFEKQGYYRDNQWNKLQPSEIDLLAIPKDFNPYKN